MSLKAPGALDPNLRHYLAPLPETLAGQVRGQRTLGAIMRSNPPFSVDGLPLNPRSVPFPYNLDSAAILGIRARVPKQPLLPWPKA
jgi:hypothetical protein